MPCGSPCSLVFIAPTRLVQVAIAQNSWQWLLRLPTQLSFGHINCWYASVPDHFGRLKFSVLFTVFATRLNYLANVVLACFESELPLVASRCKRNQTRQTMSDSVIYEAQDRFSRVPVWGRKPHMSAMQLLLTKPKVFIARKCINRTLACVNLLKWTSQWTLCRFRRWRRCWSPVARRLRVCL